MGLIDQIRLDVQRITSNINDFPIEINMIAPTGETAILTGIHTKHHLGVDTEGNAINSKKSSVAFSESLLLAPYPVRNINGEVDMRNHRVNAKDSTGIEKQYIVQQWFPDETIGLLVLILEDFQE
jgi:hypothetical protein